ncbi:hypothetical protein A2368_03220 [Candidatus Collierbacteria bacterium RIFOXYB1_FULL_49_13]|uniref:Uncharacterized protein n=1 Tax=Candidatus Collierbacteria bacterium RIFOXYB1_FULL_49_13 TaxID=1817728 RepID=A0A1F5FJV6_9BACT|nr:MAG: hypothetical protein A2368_03220 [Candidatus Collierbacteria bacterium RIFOXYB1_FULL_49_13]
MVIVMEVVLGDGQLLSLRSENDGMRLHFYKDPVGLTLLDVWVMSSRPDHFLTCAERLLAADSAQSFWTLSQLGLYGSLTALDNTKVRLLFSTKPQARPVDVELTRMVFSALVTNIANYFDK